MLVIKLIPNSIFLWKLKLHSSWAVLSLRRGTMAAKRRLRSTTSGQGVKLHGREDEGGETYLPLDVTLALAVVYCGAGLLQVKELRAGGRMSVVARLGAGGRAIRHTLLSSCELCTANREQASCKSEHQ